MIAEGWNYFFFGVVVLVVKQNVKPGFRGHSSWHFEIWKSAPTSVSCINFSQIDKSSAVSISTKHLSRQFKMVPSFPVVTTAIRIQSLCIYSQILARENSTIENNFSIASICFYIYTRYITTSVI